MIKRFFPVALVLALQLALVACEENGTAEKKMRNYQFRAISGFSMGSSSAAIVGLRHPELFDIVAPLGGAVDLSVLLHIIKDELLAGFCVPPQLGKMCPAYPGANTYEHMNVGLPSQGGFRRTGMIEAFEDLSIAMGNPIMFNRSDPYLPPGITKDVLEESKQQFCSNPVRLSGFFDWRFNPEGKYPVITFCEANNPDQENHRGEFDPSATPTQPVEITLAVDLNDNGVRDSGEPVLFQASERFDDWGEDGVPSEQEPGYDPETNPDPAGDDWSAMENPLGTENNGAWDEGEPYLDYGLDGVQGTADSPYDWGEGNGRFDLNMNLLLSAVKYDPARLIMDLTDEQLSRLDFYVDVGVRDHLRFRDTTESFVGKLMARGRKVDVRDTFRSLLEPDYDGAFHISHIDWKHLGRDVFVRYGHEDATEAQLAAGDGGHVGSYDQTLWRFFTICAYVSEHWPGGDYEKLGPEYRARLDDKTYHSEILGMDRQYYVLLPPGYDERPDVRYPVLYMLHGIGMSASDLTASALFTPDWMSQGLLQKFIMVFPDGECQEDCFSGNFFLNQAGRDLPPRRYEDSLIQELVPYVDANYRTRQPEDLEFEQ